MNESAQSRQLSRGLKVIIALAVLTAIEFLVAVEITTGRFGILSVIALIKAALIVEYFMHYSRLWSDSDDGH